MGNRFVRALGTVAVSAALTGTALATNAPATAAEPGIQRPTLTVVCAAPHHGIQFTAARFTQAGKWAAGGKVRVTIARAASDRPSEVLHARTGPHGWFHVRRTMYSDGPPAWVAGASYTWTTTISGDTWAVARRGSVTLTGSC